MRAVYEQIRDLQQDDRRALIVGEQGVGKELVARAIHFGGKRADHPFVAVRCTTLPVATESLAQRTAVMSDLFGHVKDAFPEADADRDGLLQQAQSGTLFLDEVGMLPPPLQSQLSRVFTSQQVRRLGDTTDAPLDVRILAATSETVETLVEVGDFNRELYEYLAVYRIDLPPLRDRQEDIAVLAQTIADEVAIQLDRKAVPLSDEVLQQLRQLTLPGNVRELRRLMESALRAKKDGPLEPGDLAPL